VSRPRRSTLNAPRFVGIDVSKDHLALHLRPEGTAFRVDNGEAGVALVVARLTASGRT